MTIMSEVKSPKTLNEIVEELKGSMVEKFPEQRGKIVSYADSAMKFIEESVNDNRGLDEICAFFRQFDTIHSGKMDPEVQHEIEVMRFLIRSQIMEGNILMPQPKNNKSPLPKEK